MDGRSLTILAVLAGFVGSAVWLSSEVDQFAADEAGAVAAALVAGLGEFIDESELKSPPADLVGDLSLCVDAKTEIDLAAVDRDLAGTLIRVIPAKRCTSKTVEGDFGMFTALTTWYDEKGEEAGHLEIEAVQCQSMRRCIVDIDSRGAGMRYEVERVGDGWSVTTRRMRWVV
jgi:hypothetical protein